MNQHIWVKPMLDGLMTFGLLFLMGYQFWGNVAHEWVGAGMFLLWIVHHLLNRHWYKHLFHGTYSPFRLVQLILNLAVLAAMLGLMASSVLLSQHIFGFLHLHGHLAVARLVHMSSSFWGFVCMALHLGLHWGMCLGWFKRALKGRTPSRLCLAGLRLAGAAVALYGVAAFFRRDFPVYMLVQTHFVSLDFGEPKLLFYLDYLAILGACIFLSHYAGHLLRRAQKPSAIPTHTQD